MADILGALRQYGQRVSQYPPIREAAEAVAPVARQAGRVAFGPGDLSQPAEQRYTPAYTDWPLKDYGYTDPTARPPQGWWKQAPGAQR